MTRMNHIHIPYFVYQELKKPKYKLGKGIKQFNSEEDLDQGVLFFDKENNFIDSKRFEIENIIPEYVLLPRFLWLENMEKLEEFIAVDDQGNKYFGKDFLNEEFNLIDEYKMDIGDIDEKLNYIKKRTLKIQPRENQLPILNELYKNLKEKDYIRGILQAAPGTGKTYMAINFSKIFDKVLIIVPKNILVDQWKKELISFLNINEEQIGILQGSDEKDIIENLNKDIIITKPQSLLSQIKRNNIFKLQELYEKVNLVIYDECHGAGAEGYSKSLSLFKTPNILGLTATPYRKGVNEFLLKNSIGEVLIEAEARVLTPEVYFRNLPQDFIEFTQQEFNKFRQLSEYPMKLAFFNMYLEKKNNYIDHICDWIKWGLDQDREIVILFSTNKLGKKLFNFFNAKYPDLFNNNEVLFLTGNSKKDAAEIAKVKNRKLKEELKEYKEELNEQVKAKELKRKEADLLYKQRREEIKEIQDLNLKRAMDLYDEKIKESKIIISNFSLLREGFDKPKLSMVIFGSPVIGRIPVIQSLGRITRLADKPQPVALFLIPEAFQKINQNVFRILQNNIKSTYKDARITYV